MPIIISLLRGINVGGNKKIKMADLRDLYQSLGFENTKTLLQSDNAIFKTNLIDLKDIQTTIEKGIEEKFGFDVTIISRTPEQFQEIIDKHPFTNTQISDPGKIAFVFLDNQPTEEAINTLRDNNPGREEISANGYELYIFYTDGKGRSKLDNNRIERMLEVKATARNWNTVQKILDILNDFDM